MERARIGEGVISEKGGFRGGDFHGVYRRGLAAFSRLDPANGITLRKKQIYENFLRGYQRHHEPETPVSDYKPATSSVQSGPKT